MTLTESTVEEAALEWFGEQTRCAHTLTPALSQGEREEHQYGPEMAPGDAAALATCKDYLAVRWEGRREPAMANRFDFRRQLATRGEAQQVVICDEYCCNWYISRHM